MKGQIRKLGLGIVDKMPWGSHLCQFYQTKEDLIDILVPYFKVGVENNEFCMWVTSEPLDVQDAKASLQKAVNNLDEYIEKGQIEILGHSQGYTKSGKFNPDAVLQAWVEKENQALKRGFDGLRLSGNTFWLEKNDWKAFTEYEETVDNIIGNYRILAICSYSLDKCGPSEIIDVVRSHKFALIRLRGKWELIENIGRKQAEQALQKAYDELEFRVRERTTDLTAANKKLQQEITNRIHVEEQIKASLKEKEVLLREVHHRVKNNLQIISSLLDMRIMRTDNQQVIDLFEETRSKIHTMALIHTQLYRSERFDQINMGAHIQELVDYLSSIYVKRAVSVTPIIEHSDVNLSVTQAIPCALVLNELVSNAFKHAFKEGQKGRIEVSLKRRDHDKVFLRVKDNGIGIPEEIDILKTNSLGFKLMRNTVQDQLMGEIHIEHGVGTTIIVEFKILEEGRNHVKDTNSR